MNAAVRIDPETGLKVFNTRAAKASERITGKGYSVVTDQKLTELPKMPAGATFNAEEQAKYRAFKEARRGAADYMANGRRVQEISGRRLFGAADSA